MIFKCVSHKAWAPASALLLVAIGACAQTNILDVKTFGAVGDGKTSDTAAIQRAIDECSQRGGAFLMQFDSVHQATFNGFAKSPPKIQGQVNGGIRFAAP